MIKLKDFLQSCLNISINCRHESFPEKYRKVYYKPVDLFSDISSNGDKYLYDAPIEWIKGVGITDDNRPIIQIQLGEDWRFTHCLCKTCYLP